MPWTTAAQGGDPLSGMGMICAAASQKLTDQQRAAREGDRGQRAHDEV